MDNYLYISTAHHPAGAVDKVKTSPSLSLKSILNVDHNLHMCYVLRELYVKERTIYINHSECFIDVPEGMLLQLNIEFT